MNLTWSSNLEASFQAVRRGLWLESTRPIIPDNDSFFWTAPGKNYEHHEFLFGKIAHALVHDWGRRSAVRFFVVDRKLCRAQPRSDSESRQEAKYNREEGVQR